jgi:hypothetical protein
MYNAVALNEDLRNQNFVIMTNSVACNLLYATNNTFMYQKM